MNEREVFEMICRAWKSCRQDCVEVDHRRRSEFWVNCLAEELKRYYQPQKKDVMVFWRGNAEHRRDFLLNEFLFDISVCRIGGAVSQRLPYVSELLWAIESQLAHNRHFALKDFSKLVMSSAQNRLFIAPVVHERNVESYRQTLAAPASTCRGRVYLCEILHPARWDSHQNEPRLHIWEGGWIEYAPGSAHSGSPQGLESVG